MRLARQAPDVVTFNSAISACAKSGEWTQALDLFSQAQQPGQHGRPDVITYSAMMDACDKASKWRLALYLVQEMYTGSVLPNEVTCASAIGACTKAHNPVVSLELFEKTKLLGVRVNVKTYAAALGACHQNRELWPWALHYLGEMKQTRVAPDIGILNGVMGVCTNIAYWGQEKRSQLTMIEQLMKDVRFLQLKPDVMTYTHAMQAATQAGRWDKSLALLQELKDARLTPDGIVYGSAVTACQEGLCWEGALLLLNEMESASLLGFAQGYFSFFVVGFAVVCCCFTP
ncbi:unnamed protein product [Polarella glacialis]|uniref:Pentacotripeptide-repeat region of PRORP domain-containing protein n=1 Tax=Polarella glacialis TaxID=89957 RepID=A0A813LK23_POLGL|nr:unnamed protein product [Polarella glacialis]